MAYHPITQCPYICNVDLLWHPDHKSRPVTLDYTGTGGVIKAGTPISAAGAAANNGNAIGILLRDCYDGFHAAGNVVIDGFIRQDVAAEHSGVQLTDDAKRAMSKLVFVDASGVPDPPAGGSSGGGMSYDVIVTSTDGGATLAITHGTYADLKAKIGAHEPAHMLLLMDITDGDATMKYQIPSICSVINGSEEICGLIYMLGQPGPVSLYILPDGTAEIRV